MSPKRVAQPGTKGAAVFDLDRTLIAGSSAPQFGQALFETGVSARASYPLQGLFMRAYKTFGENLPSMALARVASGGFKGRSPAEVTKAAELAAETLVRTVSPWAIKEIAQHHKAGRVVVLATTSPELLVTPLAQHLGIDQVIATRYQIGEDGRLTGDIEGDFVWAYAKATAVAAWAEAAGIGMADVWAYSDSFYDLPMLSRAGHPTAVNPDPRLLGIAKLRSWPVAHFDAPPGVPKVLGAEVLDVARNLFAPAAFPYARFEINGVEHIPRRGPVIVAANHRSYFDVVAVGMTVFKAGRNPRAMAKQELFDAPVVGQLARAMGGIRVDRKGEAAASLAQAEEALSGGECLVIMPQGTIPRGEAFFDPVLKGKTGVSRLAAATGAPVVPLGVWGTEKVWPRSARVPNMVNVTRPPLITCHVGRPVEGLGGKNMEADTARIMEAIADLLPPEARLTRIPTAEELAKTIPKG